MVDPDPCQRGELMFRSYVCFGLFTVCVLLKKARWRRRLYEDRIRFSPLAPRLGSASCAIGWRVKVCLWRILWDSVGACLGQIYMDLVFVNLRSCV